MTVDHRPGSSPASLCLGATAARTEPLSRVASKVTQQRGVVVASPLAARVLATGTRPPSSGRGEEARRLEMKQFTADLRAAARALSSS